MSVCYCGHAPEDHNGADLDGGARCCSVTGAPEFPLMWCRCIGYDPSTEAPLTWPWFCSCGHNRLKHTQDGVGMCSANCRCWVFSPAPEGENET